MVLYKIFYNYFHQISIISYFIRKILILILYKYIYIYFYIEMKKEYQIFHKIIIIIQLQRNNSDLAAIKNFPLKTSYLYTPFISIYYIYYVAIKIANNCKNISIQTVFIMTKNFYSTLR